MRHWISIFGASNYIFSDNGGEFIGDEFYMCGKFHIKVSGTTSFSTWTNCTCEKHNHLVTIMFLKICDDVKCSYDTALAWAISAKNSLIIHNGFSPLQTVFKKNSNLPNIMNETLPELEKVTTSADLALHIATLHSAREAFMKAQISEKIKTALKKQTQQTQERYENRKGVYYKRDTDGQWEGPVNVLDQDGAIVFLRHESRFIKAHACQVQPVKSTLPIIAENEKCNKNIGQVQEDKNSRSLSESDSDSEMDNNNITEAPSNQYHDNTTNPSSLHLSLLPSLPLLLSLSSKKETSEATNQTTSLSSPSSHAPVKASSIISFNAENINYQAKVLSRARKASGKYKSC